MSRSTSTRPVPRASRIALALLVVLALVAFFAFDLGRWLSLDGLKASHAHGAALYAERPLPLLAGYFALYVAVTALSLPGAAVLTLAGGALFGLVTGALLVSFASSIGATLAMLVARHVLRDTVRARFGRRLAEIDRGLERDGAWYLLTLRLVPLVPFFVVNLLLGLTRMPARRFYAVSQLGMLPGTLAYVNAGTQLARVQSPADVWSPALLGSFVLLALLPLFGRRVTDVLRARRAYARWRGKRPLRFDRNLVVIGAGSAGLVASYIAAALKSRVTLVERDRMGGDCLNTGCVPSKALIRAATLAHAARHAGAHGVHTAEVTVDFARVMQRVADAVRQVEPHDSVARYTALGVEVLQGQAIITDPWHVAVHSADGRVETLSTRAIVVATGAAPVIPPLPGLEAAGGCLTSETLWELRALPRRLVVLGGGPIGCELAQAFARLGAAVTVVEMAPRLLMREDAAVGEAIRAALVADGVDVRTGCRALRCERGEPDAPPGAGVLVVADAVGAEHPLPYDRLLCAVGRAARLEGFGLEALGVATDRPLVVDDALRTVLPNILAAGDVAGPWQFTHTAAHQAWTAAVNALFAPWKSFTVDRSAIPRVTFTDPEVAVVGLTEGEARDQGITFETTRVDLAELDRAIVDGRTDGWLQVRTEPGRDRILGVTIVGAHAGELLAEWALAMRNGLGLNKILSTVHAYPTWVEANKAAAGAWRRTHAPQGALRWLERWHAWRRG